MLSLVTITRREIYHVEHVTTACPLGPVAAPNFSAMSHVPVQLVVGEKDTDTALLDTIKTLTTAEKEAGSTRVERVRWLKTALERQGVKCQLKVVPGVAHNGVQCLPEVERWLGHQLK